MKKLAMLLILSGITFCSAASAQCVEFLIHNHTKYTISLAKAQGEEAVCQMPATILPGKTGQLIIKKSDVIGKGDMNLVKEHPVYVSINSVGAGKHYTLFEEFQVDQQGQRIINEELISDKSAYSWEHDNHDIHLCSAKQFKQHKTCAI